MTVAALFVRRRASLLLPSMSSQLREMCDFGKENENRRMAPLVDPLTIVKTLEEKGVPSKQAETITSHLTKILDDNFENILHSFISNEEMKMKETIADAYLSRFKYYNKSSQNETKNIGVHLRNMRRNFRNDVDLVIARDCQRQQAEREKLRDELEKHNAEISGLVKILSREFSAYMAEVRKPPFDVFKGFFAKLFSVFNQTFSLRRSNSPTHPRNS